MTETFIHERPCGPCPSTRELDPEAEDILQWPRERQLESLFDCAWRGRKLCKGWCDRLGVTEEEAAPIVLGRREARV